MSKPRKKILSDPLSPMDNADIEHPTFNARFGISENDILREHGFKIVSRPRYGEPLWEIGGEIVAESIALARCGYAPLPD